MDLSTILQIVGPFAGAVGVYVGIRADLARLLERTEATQRGVDQAHARIDAMTMRCGGKA